MTSESEIRASAGASASIDQAVLAQLGAGQPGLAVAVIRKGEPVHLAGYGLADLRTRAPVTPRTIFHMASCGKQFTGLAIMMLRERLRSFDYDDHIGKYVPELAGFPQGVTIRSLLHHLSGIRDLYDWDGTAELLRQSQRPTNDDVVRTYVALNFPMRFGNPAPGEAFDYSNSGYDLLGSVIARVTEASYPDFFAKTVFSRFGMNDTYSLPEMRSGERHAAGYSNRTGDFIEMPGSPLDLIAGSGSVYSTAADLCAYEKALANHTLVGAERFKDALASGVTNTGIRTNYGFGWNVRPVNGVTFAEHAGWWTGFKSQIRRAADGRLGIYILSNNPALDLHAVSEAVVAAYL